MNRKQKTNLPSYNIKKVVTYLVVAAILLFLFKNIFQNWESIKNSNIELNFYRLLVIFIITSSLHFLNSISWHLVTLAIGLKIPLSENFRIWMLPNLSRYIPGVVWQYIGRAYLLNKQGASKSQGVLALILDGIFTFSLGSLVVLLTILFFNLQVGYNLNWLLVVVIPIPLIIALIFSNKNILNILLSFVQKISKKNFELPTKNFSALWIFILCFVTFSQFLVAGLVLFLIAREVYPLPLNLVPVFAGIYAGSWILGYISFFAPGGLGVQELSIAGLLSLFMPFPLASITSLLLRLMLVTSEFSISLLIWIVSKKQKK